MRYSVAVVGLMLSGSIPSAFAQDNPACTRLATYGLLVHGGAGAGDFPAPVRAQKYEGMLAALEVGEKVLAEGGTAKDAVVATIVHLEDSGLFNAGRGAIANNAGFVELDASLMTGHDRNAGAVAALRTIKNPILAAEAVLERSDHIMFVDRGAEAFARAQGLKTVNPDYFLATKRTRSRKPAKSGTVGAVARDRCGNLAGGTSTGGYTAKAPGRVGDSPLIGAGTYADNKTCAVSATGWGEYFIRRAAAYDVSALMAYRGTKVRPAAREVIAKIKRDGATGGLIAIDLDGNMAWPFSSKGMMRGYVTHTGEMRIGIFGPMDVVRGETGKDP